MKSFIRQKIILVISLIVTCIIISAICSSKTDYVFNDKAKKVKKVPICCVDTKDKKVALSFDVGFENDNTLKILDVLEKNNVKATFFLIGEWVESYPDITKKIYEKGNEIGNHSYMHPDMTKVSQSRIIEEIAVTDSKVKKLTGEGTILFRCPLGRYNNEVIQTIQSSSHYCIQWNINSMDWKEKGQNIEYEIVMKKLKPGSIILFHSNAKYTLQNLQRIIESIKQDGYTIVKVSDLIYRDNYYIDNSGKQIKKNEY